MPPAIANTSMTAIERAHGRLMRAPDHDAATSSSNSEANSANQTQAQNDAGQSFDASAFWNEPVSANQGSPHEGSAESKSVETGTEVGRQFAERLQNLAFSPVFTQDLAQQISEGNLEGINQALTSSNQQAVRDAFTMSAELMQLQGQQIIERVQSMIESALGNRDNQSTLLKEFPEAAANATTRPLIDSVFAQSMRHTGNDRAKAIAMTRDMLGIMGNSVGKELGLGNAPSDPFGGNAGAAKSLVDSLLENIGN